MSLIQYPKYLSKEHIEARANKTLEHLQVKSPHVSIFPLDPNRVAECLGLDIVWDTLPADNRGQILARILPIDRLIEINDSVPELRENRGLESSTIAHEIGHWVLHINHDELNGLSKQLTLDLQAEDEQPFLCRSMTKSEGVEWQAQYFASCLLMPCSILEDAVKGRKLTNWSHLYAMAEDLGVTISNLKHRLQDIGWITIPKGSKQIYLGKNMPAGQKSFLD